MTDSAATSGYWESHYQSGDTHWDKGAPSPGLEDFLAEHPEVQRGSVCVPGCGSGHDVRLLARAGFTATGLDFAPSAVQLAIERTREAGLSAAFRQCDFLRDGPAEAFDWLFEHTLFCAIPPSSREEYVRALLRWLKPGGTYLAVNYFLCEPNGPPWPVTREEILHRFTPHCELVADWVPRSYPNRTGMEHMFWWRRRAFA